VYRPGVLFALSPGRTASASEKSLDSRLEARDLLVLCSSQQAESFVLVARPQTSLA
ncbi:hypothetical protein Tco_1372197, partial [Tanacetum coccineum]